MSTITISEFTPESFAQRAATVHDINGDWYRSLYVHAPSWNENPFIFQLWQDSDNPNQVEFTFDTGEDGDNPHEIIDCFSRFTDFFDRVRTLQDNPPAPPSTNLTQHAPRVWLCLTPFTMREHSKYTRRLNRYHITHCTLPTQGTNTVTIARAHAIDGAPTMVIDVAGSGEYDTLALHLINAASTLEAETYDMHMGVCTEHPDCHYLDLAARMSDVRTAESFYWDTPPTAA